MVGGEGSDYIYLFFSRGVGARNIIILYVFQCIRMSSNSFVCLTYYYYYYYYCYYYYYYDYYDYYYQKKTLHLNSFVCIPIHSYVFQFIRMSSRRGWWVEGGDAGWGGERLYLFIFFSGGGGREILLFCMYSNAFVCLPIRVSSNSFRCMRSNSFVCLPIHSYVFSP